MQLGGKDLGGIGGEEKISGNKEPFLPQQYCYREQNRNHSKLQNKLLIAQLVKILNCFKFIIKICWSFDSVVELCHALTLAGCPVCDSSCLVEYEYTLQGYIQWYSLSGEIYRRLRLPLSGSFLLSGFSCRQKKIYFFGKKQASNPLLLSFRLFDFLSTPSFCQDQPTFDFSHLHEGKPLHTSKSSFEVCLALIVQNVSGAAHSYLSEHTWFYLFIFTCGSQGI